jgi:hypothetical protein
MLEYVNCFKSDAIMNVKQVFDDSLRKMLDDEKILCQVYHEAFKTIFKCKMDNLKKNIKQVPSYIRETCNHMNGKNQWNHKMEIISMDF